MKRINVAPEEADVVDLSHKARGVARIDGKTVFVADSLPGERVVLRRIVRHRTYDEAVTEQVLQASSMSMPCSLKVGTCGASDERAADIWPSRRIGVPPFW